MPSSAHPHSSRRPAAETVVILAAGQGKRMKSQLPKVLQPICGRPMLGYVLDQAAALQPQRILVVIGHGAGEVASFLEKERREAAITAVEQKEQRGTGHALQCCLPELAQASGRIVVLYGDMPLLRAESLLSLCTAQPEKGVAVITAFPRHTRGFGRVVRNAEANLIERIVEERDATPSERAIREVNVGVYAFALADLVRQLPGLKDDNSQGELYLTDVVAALAREGRHVVPVVLEDEAEAIGINTLVHLAEARAEVQRRILEQHLLAGVYIEDPTTAYIDHGVSIGEGARILPCTVIRSGVTIGAGCEVGPFAHLRAGTVLEPGAEVGNFTEAKNTRLGAHAKAKHLSYLGDATIGAKTNIGAGTIFANYDGRAKHATHVGERAFVGSGTILVAPARVGSGATTGAGAVVTRHSSIPDQATWVGVPARPIVRRQEKEAEGGASHAASDRAGAS